MLYPTELRGPSGMFKQPYQEFQLKTVLILRFSIVWSLWFDEADNHI